MEKGTNKIHGQCDERVENYGVIYRLHTLFVKKFFGLNTSKELVYKNGLID